ncbi:conserved hypothetical protein [Leishmania major strain Friedlin]|uniref:Uncharacterized protein n=1 Tax=Leishmania major TaxID=5664 RepID=Q4Q9D1_LEIMA|nr:conserved hypothetical protein [Leishmania major strain Friedlin]CAG9576352.1 hypothetical_protein_-_conserved [Leishmania major strain Friedlin]CAJ04823.1 conserved hypothetical protein [Leishmania major strain Friedlin]|eukprot:XP_001684067.1 conserved hypothetical protein [Leishmania major strain Friedlin]
MYREEADGSAVVWGIPVAPFLPVQHMQINVSTLNRLGNYCFRFAREHGWLQPPDEMALAAPYTQGNEARPPVEQVNHAYTGSNNTFFFAGVEEILDNPYPDFELPPRLSKLFAGAHLYLVHVGNSSYSVYSQLYTYLNDQGEAARGLVGSFKVTAVWVSKQQRTPTTLPADVQSLLRSVIEKNASKMPSSDIARVQRLSVSDLLLQSGWFANASAIASMEIAAYSPLSAPPPDASLVSLPHVCTAAPLWLLHRRHFTLRETDIDFNLHVNQLVTKMLVIDAFRGATADARCAYSRLLPPGVPPNRADILLRKFRIDYVREIPVSCVATEVFLFPVDPARAKAQFSCAGSYAGGGNVAAPTTAVIPGSDAADAPAVDMIDIGFFTVGVPSLDDGSSKDRFIATVGVMTAATCFLH